MIHFIILTLCSAFLIWLMISNVAAFSYQIMRESFWKLSARNHIQLLLLLIGISTALSLSSVIFSLKGSLDVWIFNELDHCLSHGSHHLHLCINHLQQNWNWYGIILISLLFLIFNKGLLLFFLRTWRYVLHQRAIFWLSKRTNAYHRIDTARPMIFSMGFFRPAIFLSDGMRELLCDGDLKVLLDHEQSHVINRDSLTKWLVRTLSSCFYNQSILNRDLQLRIEQRADQHALNKGADFSDLKALIQRFSNLEYRTTELSYDCGFHQIHSRERVRLLEDRADEKKNLRLLYALSLAAMSTVIFVQYKYSAALHHFLESSWSFLIS